MPRVAAGSPRQMLPPPMTMPTSTPRATTAATWRAMLSTVGGSMPNSAEPWKAWPLSLSRMRLNRSCPFGLPSGVHERAELLVAGDEVGLAVDFDQSADTAAGVDVAVDDALIGLVLQLLQRLGQATLLEQVLGLAEIAQGIFDGALALHDARAGLFSQFLDELRGTWHACLRVLVFVQLELVHHEVLFGHHGQLGRHRLDLFLGQAALGQWLALNRGARLAAFDDRVGDLARDQAHRSDGIVVRWHRPVDKLRVAVGVDHGHDWQLESIGLGDGDAFAVRIDHEDHVGQAVGFAQAAEHPLQLLQLILQLDGFLLGQLLELTVLLTLLELFHSSEAGEDGGEVGQRAAHPALIDERHTGSACLFRDRVLGLLLGADEEHGPAVGGLLAHEAHRFVQTSYRLLQVDDVDAVAFGKDERTHARIPAAGLVSEVDTRFEQRLHLDRGWHVVTSVCV